MFLRSFGSINPATMVSQVPDYTAFGTDYEVDLYLRQSWVDERLRVENLSHVMDLNDPQIVLNIWKPEVYFPNAKQAAFQYVTVPNVLVRINPGGNILYMLRLKLTFSCMMDLSKYPLDRQVCYIELSSFAKTTRELELIWSPGKPVRVIKGLKLPQFELQGIVPTYCVESFSIGEYSCLRAEFILERSVGYHLVQSYLPTTMIVIISWVSFWLDIDAIPARVTLGVTTLLTISSESTGIRSNLPPVSYIKALDVWMGTCTTFVFAALIEFTVVNYLFRKKARPTTALAHSNSSLSANGGSANCQRKTQDTCTRRDKWIVLGMAGPPLSGERKSVNPLASGHSVNSRPKPSLETVVRTPRYGNPLLAKRIDRTCRVAFPLAYVIFNAFYWTYYMM